MALDVPLNNIPIIDKESEESAIKDQINIDALSITKVNRKSGTEAFTEDCSKKILKY